MGRGGGVAVARRRRGGGGGAAAAAHSTDYPRRKQSIETMNADRGYDCYTQWNKQKVI